MVYRLEEDDDEEATRVAAEVAAKAAPKQAAKEAAKEAAMPKEQSHPDDGKRRMLKREVSRAGQLVGARAIHRSNSYAQTAYGPAASPLCCTLTLCGFGVSHTLSDGRHFFAEPSEYYKGSHDAAIRNAFLFKVRRACACTRHCSD